MVNTWFPRLASSLLMIRLGVLCMYFFCIEVLFGEILEAHRIIRLLTWLLEKFLNVRRMIFIRNNTRVTHFVLSVQYLSTSSQLNLAKRPSTLKICYLVRHDNFWPSASRHHIKPLLNGHLLYTAVVSKVTAI
jgi:hypothetical protein